MENVEFVQILPRKFKVNVRSLFAHILEKLLHDQANVNNAQIIKWWVKIKENVKKLFAEMINLLQF